MVVSVCCSGRRSSSRQVPFSSQSPPFSASTSAIYHLARNHVITSQDGDRAPRSRGGHGGAGARGGEPERGGRVQPAARRGGRVRPQRVGGVAQLWAHGGRRLGAPVPRHQLPRPRLPRRLLRRRRRPLPTVRRRLPRLRRPLRRRSRHPRFHCHAGVELQCRRGRSYAWAGQ